MSNSYSQRKYPHRVEMRFNPGEVCYAFTDSAGTRRFSVEYAQLPNPDESGVELEAHDKLRVVLGVCVCALGFLQLVLQDFLDTEAFLQATRFVNYTSAWVGMLVMFSGYWPKRRFTAIDTEKGRLVILKDKNHDEILEQIALRRKAAIVAPYWEVDTTRSAEEEAAKYRTLFANNLLDENELNERLNEVSLVFEKPSRDPQTAH